VFGQSADYPALYTERASASSFNVEVTRGLAFRADSRVLYSIHSYAGSLLRFDLDRPAVDGVLQPDGVWPTLIDPVAVALYEDQDGVCGVYVLGQGTHGLARHDPVTGALLDLFVAPAMPDPTTGLLPRNQGLSEPADLVIDPARGEAYVSCMGSDTVVRIDLKSTPMRELERWVSDEVPGGAGVSAEATAFPALGRRAAVRRAAPEREQFDDVRQRAELHQSVPVGPVRRERHRCRPRRRRVQRARGRARLAGHRPLPHHAGARLGARRAPCGRADRGALHARGDIDDAARRAIFYDARRSENSRTSCAVCHPGGESDLLVWELKDGVADFKDPMMTQTLKGLRETFP